MNLWKLVGSWGLSSMTDSNFHHYVQHKIAQDVFQTQTRELRTAKLIAYRHLLDGLEEWIKNAEVIVVR